MILGFSESVRKVRTNQLWLNNEHIVSIIFTLIHSFNHVKHIKILQRTLNNEIQAIISTVLFVVGTAASQFAF